MSTILFVDDHHALRTVFAEVLRNAGHSVLEAGTTADAEHVVKQHRGPVDLMIVEAVLTTANGLDIVRRIQPCFPEMRLLFVSGEPSGELTERGLLPARARFLRKPFAAEQLLAAVAELLVSERAASKLTYSLARRSNIRPSTAGRSGRVGNKARKIAKARARQGAKSGKPTKPRALK